MAALYKVMGGVILFLTGSEPMPVQAESQQPMPKHMMLRVEVAIRAREFRPVQVSLPAGREVTVVFQNHDAELHAFVPLTFLENVPLHVDGNGAPQFGANGLVRVLIPPGGRAEIRFVPQVEGVYQYRCDLPGHQMMGQIAVKGHMEGADPALQQGDISQGNP